MARKRNVILEFLFKSDDSDIQKDLDKVDKKSEKVSKDMTKDFDKAGKNISGSIKTAFSAFVGAVIINKIKNFFSAAISSANAFEVQMLSVAAAARQTGNSIDESRNAILKLSKDGQLSIASITKSFKLLLKQGVSAPKAFEFIEAAKKVGTFNRIVDDTGEAIFDFIKGISTMSADLVENLNPNIRSTIVKMGGLAKVSKDATLKQKLFNAIIKEGGNLTKDYANFLDTGAAAQARFNAEVERANIELGKVLSQAFAPLLNILTDAVVTVSKFFQSFNKGSQLIILITATIIALIPVIGALAIALKALSFASILNPWVLGFTLMAAAVGLAALALSELESPLEKLRKQTKKEVAEIIKLRAELKALGKISRKSTAQLKQLATVQDRLIKLAKSLKVATREANGELRKSADIERDLVIAKKGNIQATIALLKIERTQFGRRLAGRVVQAGLRQVGRLGQRRAAVSAGRLRQFRRGGFRDVSQLEQAEAAVTQRGQQAPLGDIQSRQQLAALRNINAAISDQEASLRALNVTLGNTTTSTAAVTTATTGAKKSFKGLTDFLKTDLEKALASNQKAFSDFIKSIKRAKLPFGEKRKLVLRAEVKKLEIDKATIQTFIKEVDDLTKTELQVKLGDIEIERKARLKIAKEVTRTQIEGVKKQIELLPKFGFGIATVSTQDEKKLITLQNKLNSIKEQGAKRAAAIDSKAAVESAKTQIESVTESIGLLQEIQQGGFGAVAGAGKLIGKVGESDIGKQLGFGALGALGGPIGGLIAGAGALLSSVEFATESVEVRENRRNRERLDESRNRELKLQSDLLRIQNETQRKIVDLQRKRNELISTEANEQIRLNTLTIDNDKDLADANRIVLEGALDEFLSRANLPAGISPTDLVGFIQTTRRDTVSQQGLLDRLEQLSDTLQLTGEFKNVTSAVPGEIVNAIKLLKDIPLGIEAIKIPLPGFESGEIEIGRALQGIIQFLTPALERITSDISPAQREQAERDVKDTNALLGRIIGVVNGILGNATNTLNVSNSNLEVGANALTLMEQIKDLTDIGNKDRSKMLDIQLEGQRAVSFIDIGRGGVRDIFGGFQRPRISTDALGLPQAIQQVTLATQATKSVQEQIADGIKDLVRQGEIQISVLAAIAANTDPTPATGSQNADKLITDLLASIQSRAINN